MSESLAPTVVLEDEDAYGVSMDGHGGDVLSMAESTSHYSDPGSGMRLRGEVVNGEEGEYYDAMQSHWERSQAKV